MIPQGESPGGPIPPNNAFNELLAGSEQEQAMEKLYKDTREAYLSWNGHSSLEGYSYDQGQVRDLSAVHSTERLLSYYSSQDGYKPPGTAAAGQPTQTKMSEEESLELPPWAPQSKGW